MNVNISFYKAFSIGDFKYSVNVYWFILYVNFRIGKVVILINLSFYELEIVLRVFNEIFYFMFILELGAFFRNLEIV